MSDPLLSILICALEERIKMLIPLLADLEKQVTENGATSLVEILIELDNRQKTTGEKRNILLNRSSGTYSVWADEDDWLPPYYVEEMIKACQSGYDAVGMSGIMTTDGLDLKNWYIGKDYKYCKAVELDGRECYYRYNNHLTPIKRSIAIQFGFPDKVFGEDYDYATAIHKSGLIKTEFKIERHPMYWYKFLSNKP